ncbi:unnamed protein product [Caenorhabditis sp. 36 PRJEB53466]|nr:unnamed protein product [Caenorhabditis sp. 36 PRJEB53466]
MLLFLFTIVLSALSVVIPQCQPPNDCSVHVFRVRLSQKPEDEEPENTTYKAVQNNEYGTNYYEIRGGKEMTPKLAAEIIQSMGKDADPRLKEKISNKEFYWKAVEPGGAERAMSASIPPPPATKQRTSTPENSSFKPNEFPVLLVTLLLFVGIFLGILLTAFCFFMANMRKEPHFDRSSAVIYSKVDETATEMRPMLRRDQQIDILRQEAMENSSVTRSMSSGTRIGPAFRNGNSLQLANSRHISL